MKITMLLFPLLLTAAEPKPIPDAKKLPLAQAQSELGSLESNWRQFGQPLYDKWQASAKTWQQMLDSARKEYNAGPGCGLDAKQTWVCPPEAPQPPTSAAKPDPKSPPVAAKPDPKKKE